MHEFTITRSIVTIVLQKAREVNAGKVTQVNLLLGRLTGFVPECIQLQFDILSRNTEAAGAGLVFRRPPAKLFCRKCNLDYTSDSLDLTCPRCRAMDIDIISGSECCVESMEVE